MLYVYKEITRPTPYIREEKHFHFNFDLVQIFIIVHESFHHIYFHATLVLVWPCTRAEKTACKLSFVNSYELSLLVQLSRAYTAAVSCMWVARGLFFVHV
jgi:hypothetical protein